MLECYQKYMPKVTNISRLKDCFVDDMECYKGSSITMQWCHFAKDLDRVLLQLVDIQKTLLKY